MFDPLSVLWKKIDARRDYRWVTLSRLKRPSKRLNLRICFFLSTLFFVAAPIDLLFEKPVMALPNLMIGLACLTPVIGIGLLNWRDRYTWRIGHLLYWVAVTIAIATTGGASSPIFGAYILCFFLSTVCIFVKKNVAVIFSVVGLNVLGWFLTTALGWVEPPGALTVYQVCIQNGLMLVASFCVVLNFIKVAEFYAEEAETQARRLTEAQGHLAHSERMAEMGKMVATTAHELAQPLQVIVMASTLLRRMGQSASKSEGDGILPLTDRVLEASQRITQLVTHLRTFSRRDPFVLKEVDLAEAIRSVLRLSQYDLRWRDARYELQIDEEQLWVRGDSLRIQQILFNLINNARDACGDGRGLIRVHASVFKSWVRVTVWNNGAEIPLECQKKLFQPYFTTKEPGKGTGLGLTVCHQLIEQHGGRILFASVPGDTTFVLDLPRFQPDVRNERFGTERSSEKTLIEAHPA